MRLAIVGSTRLSGHPDAIRLIDEAIDRWSPTVVVSGGARGIDSMAAESARRRCIEVREYKPLVKTWDAPGGFRERNLLIAGDCDALVRIISSRTKTYGSGWTRDRARERGIPTEEFVVEEGD